MGKYNQNTEPVQKRTVTHEGGEGFTQDPRAELVGMLSTGLEKSYYESENDRDKRFAEIFNKVATKNKTFAAKSLIYARTVFGQRTVTHRGAVELIKHLQGDELGKKFFSKRDRKTNNGGIVYRIDDMTEILACYLGINGEKTSIPNSIKKGFKDAIEHADLYQLAKYQMKNKTVSLVDIVNIVHPKETKINGFVSIPTEAYLKAVKGTKFAKQDYNEKDGVVSVPALRALVLGVLKQFNTVEDKNTDAGKKVAEAVKSGEITKEEAKVVLNEAKTENYKLLIETKKIGYLALLRNIRNILKTNDTDLLDKACGLLTQKDFIKKSLVMPHQIDIALEMMLLEFTGGDKLRTVVIALSKAYELAIPNLREAFSEGTTAIVLDTSGSMSSNWNGGCKINGKGISSVPLDKASLIAATLAKGIDADVYHFGTSCQAITGFNPLDSINTLKQLFKSKSGKAGHGTEYRTIFPTLDEVGGKYDRIFILSDEQGADSVEKTYKEYSRKHGTPHIYFINLTGYASTMLKQTTKVHRIFGYSADIYETAKKVELNPQIVIEEINNINI